MNDSIFRGQQIGRRGSFALRLCVSATVVLVGCGQRTPALQGDLAVARDHAPPVRDGDLKDRSVTPADASVKDRAVAFPDLSKPSPDAGPCGVVCKPGEVYLMSACVATEKLFTCAASCDPHGPVTCPSGSRCEQWGGTPCCVCSAAVPACVPKPTTGPVVGPLRIRPTQGSAGQKVRIVVEGAPFYVGALFYNVRMGKETKSEEGNSKSCTIAATFTPPTPGVYVVEVSQYGGGAPWVLAGFYTATSGLLPQPTIQPGYFCKSKPAPGDPACASASPYTCLCVTGRCRCQ